MIVVTGRMAQSVRRAIEPAALGDPVICYQGAVVTDGEWHWLRHEPIPLELARETIAAVLAEGYPPNVYVDDELYVESETDAARNYANFQSIEFHVVGDLLGWLEQAADEAGLRRRPGRARRRRGADARALRRPTPHLQVAAVLPRVRGGRRDQGLGPRLPGRADGVHEGADDRLRRRRERRRAARVGGLRDRGRERPRPGEGGLPTGFARRRPRRAWRRCSRRF